MRVKYVFILFLLQLGLFSSSLACDCQSPQNVDQMIENADIIFEGKVSFVNTNWMAGGWKFSFEVNRTWKRTTTKHLIINTKWEKECGYIFEEGKTYLVYANKSFGLKTAQCMGNKEIGDADEDLNMLGKGLAPVNEAQGSGMALTLILLTLASMIILGFVVLRKKKGSGGSRFEGY